MSGGGPKTVYRVVDTGRRTRDRVVAARHRHRSLHLAMSLGERDRHVAGKLLAAALAYRIFLWLLPAVLVSIAGLGFLTSSQLDSSASAFGITGYAKQQVLQASDQAHRARWTLLIVGLFALAVASAALVRTVVAATAVAWGLTIRRPRSLPRAMGVLLAAAVAILLVESLVAWLRHRSAALGLAMLIVTIVFWVALWWSLSWLLPHAQDADVLDLLPGSLLFGVGIYVLHLATILFLGHQIESSSSLYGALGVAATLLLWAYLLGRLVVVAAQFNATWLATAGSVADTGPLRRVARVLRLSRLRS